MEQTSGLGRHRERRRCYGIDDDEYEVDAYAPCSVGVVPLSTEMDGVGVLSKIPFCTGSSTVEALVLGSEPARGLCVSLDGGGVFVAETSVLGDVVSTLMLMRPTASFLASCIFFSTFTQRQQKERIQRRSEEKTYSRDMFTGDKAFVPLHFRREVIDESAVVRGFESFKEPLCKMSAKCKAECTECVTYEEHSSHSHP
jgi:hypothetical protein